jgi:hypothetical protein
VVKNLFWARAFELGFLILDISPDERKKKGPLFPEELAGLASFVDRLVMVLIDSPNRRRRRFHTGRTVKGFG